MNTTAVVISVIHSHCSNRSSISSSAALVIGIKHLSHPNANRIERSPTVSFSR